MHPNVGSTRVGGHPGNRGRRPVSEYSASVRCESVRRAARAQTGRSEYVRDLLTLSTRDIFRTPHTDRTLETTVLRRQPRRSQKFEALTRTSLPVPHLYDGPTPKERFTRTDISAWKNEVQKRVPRRPKFALASDTGPPRLGDWEVNDNFVVDPHCMFYHSSKRQPSRYFVINPEWISEKISLKVGPKAYRTTGIRYGWCC